MCCGRGVRLSTCEGILRGAVPNLSGKVNPIAQFGKGMLQLEIIMARAGSPRSKNQKDKTDRAEPIRPGKNRFLQMQRVRGCCPSLCGIMMRMDEVIRTTCCIA